MQTLLLIIATSNLIIMILLGLICYYVEQHDSNFSKRIDKVANLLEKE